MSSFDPEAVDLAALTADLDRRVAAWRRVGLVLGRTAFRDAVLDALACSAVEAEQIVETLIARGFLRIGADEVWTVQSPA